MRQRLQLGIIFFSWFMATGSQWDLVQVIAWGRMLTEYSTEMSLSAAAKKTFSGATCKMCHVAREGKKQQEANGDKTPPAKAAGKLIDLCLATKSVTVLAPISEQVGGVAALVSREGRGRASPPSPPPRV